MRRALENRRPGTRKLDLVCVQSSVTKNNSSESEIHTWIHLHTMCAQSRNALRLFCRDGAAGVVAAGVVARDEVVQPRQVGERHHQGGGRGSLLDLGRGSGRGRLLAPEARCPGELRPCRLAPASRAERPTRSPAHCPCASCRQVRTVGRANLSCPQGIGVRCIPQLVAPIDARVGGLHPRDERLRHLDSGWSRPHGRTPAWPSDLRLRNFVHRRELADFTQQQSSQRGRKSFAPFRRLRKVTPENLTKRKGSMVGFILLII